MLDSQLRGPFSYERLTAQDVSFRIRDADDNRLGTCYVEENAKTITDALNKLHSAPQREEHPSVHRWNIFEEAGSGNLILCRGLHEKNEACEERRYRLENAPRQEPLKASAVLKAWMFAYTSLGADEATALKMVRAEIAAARGAGEI